MKKVLAASLLLLIFCSCNKNTANPAGPVGLLKSYSTKQSIPGVTGATNGISIFYYDNQQRVAQIVSVSIDSSNSPVTRDTSIYNFSYPGSSVYPSTYTDQEGVYMAFHNLSYDAQNRLTQDSITNIVPAYVRSGDYNAYNKHISYPGNMSIGLYTYYENHTLFQVDSITITNQNPTTINTTLPPSGSKTVATLGFGASLNPLYALNISPIIPLAEFSGKNLPVTETANIYQAGTSPTSASLSYQYIFNGDGQLTQTGIYYGPVLLTTITYQYQ